MYTTEEISQMDMSTLRKAAREIYSGKNKTQIAYMKKTELAKLVSGDIEEIEMPTEEIKTEPSNGNGNGNGSSDLADVLAKALEGRIKTSAMDEDKVNAIINDVLAERLADVYKEIEKISKNNMTDIKVLLPNGKKINIGKQHKLFKKVLDIASIKIPVMLVGPAGSGKSRVCESVAKALSLSFKYIAVGLQTTKSDLLGYMNAQGGYVTTRLREAYENGGVFLLDEIDAGNPNVITILNNMTSNDTASFPDKMVKKHDDFILIAAANTYGLGGDIQYVGRNQLDAATLDRFIVLDFPYDEKLEATFTKNKKWFDRVVLTRKTASKLHERVVISPRATVNGAKLLDIGFPEKQVVDMTIYKGVNSGVKNRIENQYKTEIAKKEIAQVEKDAKTAEIETAEAELVETFGG